jgi:hypothetical protein
VHALFIIASVLPARSAIAATISNVIFIGDLASQEPIGLLRTQAVPGSLLDQSLLSSCAASVGHS